MSGSRNIRGASATVGFPEEGIHFNELTASALIWTAWRPGDLDAAERGKVPITPKTGRKARVNDPNSWGTREAALKRADLLRIEFDGSGIGTMLAPLEAFPGWCLCGIDMDGCRNPKTRKFVPWAKELLERLDTYAEASPSGRGVHVFFTCREADREALKALRLIEGAWGRVSKAGVGVECAPFLGGGKFLTYTGDPVDLFRDILGAVTVKPLSKSDLEWLFGQFGPQLRQSHGGDAGGGDTSGSGLGFKFLCDVMRDGLTDDQAREAIASNDDAAGEWWARAGDHQQENTIRNARRRIDAEQERRTRRSANSFEHLEETLAPKDNRHVRAINREYGVANVTGGVAIVRFKDDDFDLLGRQAFELKLANRFVIVDEKRVPLSRYWLEHPLRRDYDDIVFDPSGKAPETVLNLWRGFAVEPDQLGRCDRFLALLEDVICPNDQAARDYLIKWLAHLVQFPEVKPGVAIVLIGDKGVGKDSFFEYVGAMLRPANYLCMDSPKHLTGDFNAHLERCLLAHMQEGVFAGNKAQGEVLKSRITSKRQPIERKGFDLFEVDSYMRVAITSNSWSAVLASGDERRYAVFRCAGKRSRDYYDAFHRERESGGPAALLAFLQALDLSDFDVREAPFTEGLAQQKLASLDGIPAWWLNVLRTGYLPSPDWVDFDFDWRARSAWVVTQDLLLDYTQWLAGRRFAGNPPDESVFIKDFLKICPGAAPRRRTKPNTKERPPGYDIPVWLECVREFEQLYGVSTNLLPERD